MSKDKHSGVTAPLRFVTEIYAEGHNKMHADIITCEAHKEAAQQRWDGQGHPIAHFHRKAREFFNQVSESEIMGEFRKVPKHLDLLELSEKEQAAGLYTRFPSPEMVDHLTEAENLHAKEKYQESLIVGTPLSIGDKLAYYASHLGIRTGMGRMAVGFLYQSKMGLTGALKDNIHPAHASTAILHATMDPSAGF